MTFQGFLTTVETKIGKKCGEAGEEPCPVERRKHPRFSVELPFDYSLFEGGEDHRGILAEASEGGLLVHLMERVEHGALVKMEILFSRGTELVSIVAIARVVWCGAVAEGNWARYRYGLQFLSFLKGDMVKLKRLLEELRQRH